MHRKRELSAQPPLTTSLKTLVVAHSGGGWIFLFLKPIADRMWEYNKPLYHSWSIKKTKSENQRMLYSLLRNALHITDYLYIKTSLISQCSGQHVLSFRVFLNENWDACTSRPVKWFCCYDSKNISPNKGKQITTALIYNTHSSLERALTMQQTVWCTWSYAG